MKTSRIIHWVLAAISGTILIVMNVWSVPLIESHAEGIRVFDNRPFGYSLEDARGFLGALDETGRQFYLGTQRHLDTLFPVSFMIAMPWALWLLSEDMPRQMRRFMVICGTLGPICDLSENYLVAEMLRVGADGIDADLVTLASQFSVTKWVLDLVAGASLLLLGWTHLLRRWSPA